MRAPLPEPLFLTEPYWGSGKDGVLKVQRCQTCGALRMPPSAACRECRSTDLDFVEVSGKGVVVGVTVNYQQWLPTMPPPYTLAIVALEEDDRARIHTRLVGVEPEDARVGQYVKVAFEQVADDVWLPVFEADPERAGETGPLPEPADLSTRLPVVRTGPKYEDAAIISGHGQSEVGRRLMRNPLSLTIEACQRAVADAGLSFDDIDGLSTYPGGSMGGMAEGGVTAVEDALGLHPTWVNGASETSGQLGAVQAAVLAVASGLCRHVLVFRTVWQASESALQRQGRALPASGPARGMMEYTLPYGAASAANWIALQASNYMHRYNVGREAMGWLAVTARTGAGLNPEAVYRDPLTFDDYMSARMISTPFGLYDCDTPVDGAVAFVISSADVAEDLPKPPIRFEAIGSAILETLSWDQGTLNYLPQSQGPSKHLWTRTDLTTDDVDLAMMYDGFTFNAVSWIEGLGFCGPGEAADFFDEGRTIAIDGSLPVNPNGGQLSAGRLHGFGFMREAVIQLRGEAGDRQVPDDPRVAAVTAGGGIPSGAFLLRRD